MDLSTRDERLREIMDDPDCDPHRLRSTLRRFGIVNRLVAGWDAVYRNTVREILLDLDRPARVLDIGSGGGDVVSRLARLASRDGLDVEWTGADPDPRAHEVALTRERAGITFHCMDADALVERGESFDIVLSNHVLHHLTRNELEEFTETSRRLATTAVLHGDIARGRAAYALFAVGITPLAPGTFLRTDGLRSIRRSYRREELASALGPGWEVSSPAPFRLIARSDGRA